MIRLYKIITNIIFILLIAVLGVYVFFRFTNKVEIYCVQTGSMEDNIHVGDYVLIYKKDNYNVGDVVTYQKDDYFITHRIIRRENNEFITKGDANNTEDEKINLNKIIGKVIISGGILNIIVNYKYALAALFVALYLVSCYFTGGKEETSLSIDSENKEDEFNINNEEINVNAKDSSNTDKDDTKFENKEESMSDELQENNDLKEESIEEVISNIESKEESEQLVNDEIEKNSDNINDLDNNDINEENKENNLKEDSEKEVNNDVNNIDSQEKAEVENHEQNELQTKITNKKKKNTQSKK